ncbi:MAG TPA: hypothetical protein VGQ36_27985 [Thermoanaerobaculia bacterium]|nr:hypothetical protein [Thermoanaerobaculia bacterium]
MLFAVEGHVPRSDDLSGGSGFAFQELPAQISPRASDRIERLEFQRGQLTPVAVVVSLFDVLARRGDDSRKVLQFRRGRLVETETADFLDRVDVQQRGIGDRHQP